jgi:hypothetical protein
MTALKTEGRPPTPAFCMARTKGEVQVLDVPPLFRRRGSSYRTRQPTKVRETM